MEHSQYDGDLYFSQLDTIKTIENSLNQLKSRIQYLQKQQDRTVEQIQKVFTSTIPIMKNKIAESHLNAKNNNIKTQMQQNKYEKFQQIRLSRMGQQNQLVKTKMQLNKTKAHQSLHIREMSKKNQKIIQNAKIKCIQQKKRKSELVKMFHMQSKRKIQSFHQQKQVQFRRARNQQKAQMDRRIQMISQSLLKVAKIQEEQQKKYITHEKMLKNLKRIVLQLQGMKPQALQQILYSLKLSQQSLDDQNNIQKILLQIDRRKKNSQSEEFFDNLTKNEKLVHGRNKSQSMDIQYIYGKGYYKKMR